MEGAEAVILTTSYNFEALQTNAMMSNPPIS